MPRYANADLGRAWVRHNEFLEGAKHGKSKNASFSGPLLYSWDTPIAAYHLNDSDVAYVLATTQTYGVATAGQLTRALLTVNSAMFRVPWIGATGGRSEEQPWTHAEMLAKNALFLFEQLAEVGQACCRNWWQEADKAPYGEDHWRNTFERSVQGYERFLRITGAVGPKADHKLLASEIEADRKAKRGAWEAPSAKLRRERAAARKLALEVFGIE